MVAQSRLQSSSPGREVGSHSVVAVPLHNNRGDTQPSLSPHNEAWAAMVNGARQARVLPDMAKAFDYALQHRDRLVGNPLEQVSLSVVDAFQDTERFDAAFNRVGQLRKKAEGRFSEDRRSALIAELTKFFAEALLVQYAQHLHSSSGSIAYTGAEEVRAVWNLVLGRELTQPPTLLGLEHTPEGHIVTAAYELETSPASSQAIKRARGWRGLNTAYVARGKVAQDAPLYVLTFAGREYGMRLDRTEVSEPEQFTIRVAPVLMGDIRELARAVVDDSQTTSTAYRSDMVSRRTVEQQRAANAASQPSYRNGTM